MHSKSITIAQLKKPLLRTTVGLFGFSAALGVIFIISAPEEEAWRILATTTLLAFFSLFTTNNLLRLESPNRAIKTLAITAIASNLLWALPLLALIWSTGSWFDGVWKMVWCFSVLSLCLTLTGSFLNMKSESTAFQNTRIVAIASAWLLYVYMLPIILGAEGSYLGDSWQFVAIVSIVFAFSAISTPILARLKGAPKQQNDDDYRARIRAELRAEVEAEVRQQIAREQAAKQQRDSSES